MLYRDGKIVGNVTTVTAERIELTSDTKIPKPDYSFELSLYAPDAYKPGYLKFVRNLKFAEAAEGLRTATKPWIDEYISFTAELDRYANVNAPIPDLWRVSSWVAEGDNEGHFVHVELRPAAELEHTIPFALIKTFLGEDYAWELAKFVTRVMTV